MTRDDLPALVAAAVATVIIIAIFVVAALSGVPFGGL